VAHLRKDRRHIQDEDVFLIKDVIGIPFNLEMSTDSSIVDIACRLRPAQATLVPENRKELTTEGGIDLIKKHKRVEKALRCLGKKGIKVSLFIDPIKSQIKIAGELGVNAIEINTGRFCQAQGKVSRGREVERIKKASVFAKSQNLFVAAGHGLDYKNVKEIQKIKQIQELNIGHSIICESIFLGIVPAVKKMISLL